VGDDGEDPFPHPYRLLRLRVEPRILDGQGLVFRPRSFGDEARSFGSRAAGLGQGSLFLGVFSPRDVLSPNPIAIESDRELVRDGVDEHQVRFVEGLGPFQLEGAKGRAVTYDERDDDEPVGQVLYGTRRPW
jgi:hypothetical protein